MKKRAYLYICVKQLLDLTRNTLLWLRCHITGRTYILLRKKTATRLISGLMHNSEQLKYRDLTTMHSSVEKVGQIEGFVRG